MTLQFYAYETQQVTVSYYDFHYIIDSGSGDFGTYTSALLHQITTNAIIGTNTLTWNGLLTNGLLHGADMLKYEVGSVELDGGTNQDLFAPLYVEGNAEVYSDYDTQDASPWKNRAGVFSVGDNGMVPLIVHNVYYPSLIENQPIDRRVTVDDWIPFQGDGSVATESDPAPVFGVVTRLMPTNVVIYRDQHATVHDYSVEAYRTTPAFASVVHAVFTMDRDARLTASLYDPDLNSYLVSMRLTNGTEVVVTNYPFAAGYHDVEFMAIRTNGVRPKLFKDRSDGQLTYGFRFAVDDERTGHRTVKWAGVTIIH